MAGSRKNPATVYVLKKGGTDVVDPCKGWFEPCEYCDKRFCKWIPFDERAYEKIPEKPGFAMISLKNKNCIEVVSIIYDKINIQKCATTNMESIKEHIFDKKNKASKFTILVKWTVIKKEENQENSILCAHWYNTGTLPRFLKSWPGDEFLNETKALEFSKQLQKWCYLKKNPVWRKPKPLPSKVIEEVKKCNLQSCEICDKYFPPWKPLKDVIANDLAPDDKGLVMFSAVTEESREIVAVISGKYRIRVNIKNTVEQFHSERYYDVPGSKFKNKNTEYEVRWMSPTDTKSDNLCFLYAHWLNADRWPVFNYSHMPGENILNKSKSFVLRNIDKKWLHKTEAFRQSKFNKAKSRRSILDVANEEQFEYDSFSD